METIRDIRIRLNSINNTKQITQSMRLISTRKVQKTRFRMEANRPFLEQSAKIVNNMVNEFQFQNHRYIAGRKAEKSLIILITGDRGLCGGYNVNVEKEAYALMKKLGDAEIITIGTKGRDYFRRRQKSLVQTFRGLSENPFYEDARGIGAIALKMYDSGEVDQVYLVYTEYHSILLQTPKSVLLLPLKKNARGSDFIMTYDSDEETFFEYAVSKYITSVIFGTMLESAVSEQCARIMSMDSAVKNSEKMIDSLTLQYNQMRQGAITQEIAEIVGGANAVAQVDK
jgi:F-type H+-transporting ATPase subunit gamma